MHRYTMPTHLHPHQEKLWRVGHDFIVIGGLWPPIEGWPGRVEPSRFRGRNQAFLRVQAGCPTQMELLLLTVPRDKEHPEANDHKTTGCRHRRQTRRKSGRRDALQDEPAPWATCI